MTLRRLSALLLLAALAVAQASPATVATELGTRLGASAQPCPAALTEATCVLVADDVAATAGRIGSVWPELGTALWTASPAHDLVTTVEAGATLLQLRPDPGGTLIVTRPSAAATAGTPASTPATTPATTPASRPPVATMVNPEGAYVVVLDAQDQPVLDLLRAPAGTYRVIASRAGLRTARWNITASGTGLPTVIVPTFAAITAAAGTGTITLPRSTAHLFVVTTEDGRLITDISALAPGTYVVMSFLGGVPGPIAAGVRVEAGRSAAPVFNEPFPSSPPVATPTFTTPTPAAAPSNTPSAAPGTSGGQCWVNGYTRANGTRVSGYYRRC